MPDQSPVVIVGAGVTGLTAAWALRDCGRAVHVLDAGDRIGGQVHTVAFRDRPVDLGAEAVHLAAPGTAALLAELGLMPSRVESGPGGTLIGDGRARLRRLPPGVGPAGPTRLGPLLGSGILGPWGLARAAAEPLLARRRIGESDMSVRRFVAGRFGAHVADRLVDPLLGGLHSGDIGRLSLLAAAPQLAAMGRAGRSVTLSRKARRAAPSVAPAAFVTWADGLGRLPQTLLQASGATVQLGVRVVGVHRAASGDTSARYAVHLADGTLLPADAVVLAVPSSVAAELLAELSPVAAEALGGQRFASVATVVAAFPASVRDRVPALAGTGILLSSKSTRALKAATFLGTKWPHLGAGEDYLLRMSAGRAGSSLADDLDDDSLVSAVLTDLRELIGLRAGPLDVRVQRWPRTMPQLEVGHLQRLAAARGALAAYPGVLLAGASYEGVGIASCVRSAREAAASVTALFGA